MARRICLVSGLNSHLSTFRDPKRSNWYSPGHSVGFSSAPLGQNLAGSGRSVGVNFDPLLGTTLAILCLLERENQPRRRLGQKAPYWSAQPKVASAELRFDKTCTSTCSTEMGNPFGRLSTPDPLCMQAALSTTRCCNASLVRGRKDSSLQGKGWDDGTASTDG